MMYQSGKALYENTNSVQFLQISGDGSRQGNYFLSSAPGAAKYNGYTDSNTETGTFGSGPVNSFMVAGE
jgi:hypothetical protein